MDANKAIQAGETVRTCGFIAAYYFVAASVVGPLLALMVTTIYILIVRGAR